MEIGWAGLSDGGIATAVLVSHAKIDVGAIAKYGGGFPAQLT